MRLLGGGNPMPSLRPNVDLTVLPGRHGPFRLHPPWRVVAAIQEINAAR